MLRSLAVLLALHTSTRAEVVLGIDLGTTNSVAYDGQATSAKQTVIGADFGFYGVRFARLDADGRVEPARFDAHLDQQKMPFATGFAASGELRFGHRAEPLAQQGHQRVFSAMKLVIGGARTSELFHLFNDAQLGGASVREDIVQLEGGPTRVLFLCAAVLQQGANVLTSDGIRMNATYVFTVPRHWNRTARERLVTTAQIAGLDVRLLNDAKALALSVQSVRNKRQQSGTKFLLVLDVGVTHSQCTLLSVGESKVEELLYKYSTTGGIDLDIAVARLVLSKAHVSIPTPKQVRRLLDCAKQAKEQLSLAEQITVDLDFLRPGLKVQIHRAELDKDVRNWTVQIFKPLHDVLTQIQDHEHEVDLICFTGGSAAQPRARSLWNELRRDNELLQVESGVRELQVKDGCVPAVHGATLHNHVRSTMDEADAGACSLDLSMRQNGVDWLRKQSQAVRNAEILEQHKCDLDARMIHYMKSPVDAFAICQRLVQDPRPDLNDLQSCSNFFEAATAFVNNLSSRAVNENVSKDLPAGKSPRAKWLRHPLLFIKRAYLRALQPRMSRASRARG